MNHDDDTCPHLVVLGRLEAENARLKAEVDGYKHTGYSIGMLQNKLTQKCQDYLEAQKQNEANVQLVRELKAEVERLEANTIKLCTHGDAEIARLKAEVENLKKPAVIGGYNISEYIRMANSETLEFDNGDMFADMTLPERIKYIVESHARLKVDMERVRDDRLNQGLLIQALTSERDYLKAEVERLEANTTKLCNHGDAEIARLKAEVERLKSLCDCLGMGGKHTITAIESENTSLKAEVEELKLENSQYEEHHKYGQNVITSLREEVERLTEESDILQKCCEHQKNRIERLKQNEQLIDAGNALHDAAKIAVKWGVTATQMGMPRALYDACRNWNAAKEGKQP